MPEDSDNVTVSGRVLYRGAPLEAANVLLYKSIDDLQHNKPYKKCLTDEDGRYVTNKLKSGAYFFVASKGNDYFSYSGRNPVTLQGSDNFWVGFQAEKAEPQREADYDDEDSSAISGQVLYNGSAVPGASVTIFLDDSDDFKGPGYSISTTDSNGEFFFDYLEETEYYILVRKRSSGEKVGPIYAEDIFAYYHGNPISAENGKVKHVVLNSVKKIFDERAISTALPETGFSGKVIDKSGNPVMGVHVFAYTDPVIGHKRPKALSLVTKEDGKYVLELKDGGTYFIGARVRHLVNLCPRTLYSAQQNSIARAGRQAYMSHQPPYLRLPRQNYLLALYQNPCTHISLYPLALHLLSTRDPVYRRPHMHLLHTYWWQKVSASKV
ncbi:collagen binding domain-containing protein [Thermodesulfobacteriota bacterium]